MSIKDSLNSPIQGSVAEKALYVIGFFIIFIFEFFAYAIGLLALGAGLALKASDQNTTSINQVLTSPLILTGIVTILGTVILFPVIYNRLWKKISNNNTAWYTNLVFVIISLIPLIFMILKAKVK